MRAQCFILVFASVVLAADSSWLNSVAPIITPAERKTYLALPTNDRAAFEEKFWESRSIDREEYDRRIAFIDSHFGSSKVGSGANTDLGRVYLSLGPPAKVTRIPSSRIFVPLEIWYYDSVPGYLNTELRLIFYRPNAVGVPKLYSPAIDTIRALLLPEASSVHMFSPNDSVTESDIRRNLKTGAAEDEVVTAAVGVASGIKYSGNEEILGRVTSPEVMLAKARRTLVTSRFIARPPLDVMHSQSAGGATQVDFRLLADAQHEIGLEIELGFASLYRNRLSLNFAEARQVEYTHRLDLLPGSYRVIVTIDSKPFAYSLDIPEKNALGEIVRADVLADVAGRRTPFEFGGRQLSLNPAGRLAVVSIPQPGKVTWTIRQGWQIVWRSAVQASAVAMVELPSLAPGLYQLEASTGGDSGIADLPVPAPPAACGSATLVSFNANLATAQRLAFIGNQWLLRGRFDRSREMLNASLARGTTKDAQVSLARLDAMTGSLDSARDRVRAVLAAHPDDFEALAVFAYIETKFQDYPVAAELYRRALAVQDSPALRMALAKLPTP